MFPYGLQNDIFAIEDDPYGEPQSRYVFVEVL